MPVLTNAQVAQLLGRRTFIFLDEWLTYILFLYLYHQQEYILIIVLVPFAIAFNIRGYLDLWKLRVIYGVI